jgi:hypothetical protein
VNKQFIYGTGAAVTAFVAVKLIKHFLFNSKGKTHEANEK